jgi:hypothetical protein
MIAFGLFHMGANQRFERFDGTQERVELLGSSFSHGFLLHPSMQEHQQ